MLKMCSFLGIVQGKQRRDKLKLENIIPCSGNIDAKH